MERLPSGAWQGALLAVVGGSIQSAIHGNPIDIIGIGTWIVLGALIGMGVAKLWAKRAR